MLRCIELCCVVLCRVVLSCVKAQDVEGFEPAVMTTATLLLSSGAIDNLVLEYTPGVLERAAK